MTGETLIQHLPATSAITIKRLIALDIHTYEDLLNYFPFRYENYSLISTIDQAQPTEKLTLKGKIIAVYNEYTKKGKNIQRIHLANGARQIPIIWFNQPFIVRTIRPDQIVSIAGTIGVFGQSLVMHAEHYEILSSLNDDTVHTGRLIPIYPEIRGLSSRTLREKIWRVLTQYVPNEIFPSSVIDQYHLMSEKNAYMHIHFPHNLQKAQEARRRLGFDEISMIQLSSQIIKKEWDKEKTSAQLHITQPMLNEFIHHLPFTLTLAQQRCFNEIAADLAKKKPMNRLLQGEVGSGKTVVAAGGALMAYRNKSKTLILAPTEILAQQHYTTLLELFQHTTHRPRVALYTGSFKPKEHELDAIDIIIGTHALISAKKPFSSVGLVIVDEQHKFGVVQRALLKEKGMNPHLLTMTATPIPRTVLLTLHGELDISIIDEMPQGRIKIKTYLVENDKRNDAYTWIKKQMNTHRMQIFIVCPLIEESDKETLKSVKAAKAEFQHLQKVVFPEYHLGLLHGKMKSHEKNTIMQDFSQKRIDILISTSLVEVGIDIPNAGIIIIEAAECFGLAQLHQLRGRVGRGDKQSYCLLFTQKNSQKITDRLKIFTKTNNGFELSEYDLKMRGAGELYGKKQHGASQLKIADLTDFLLIQEAKNAISDFLRQNQLDHFPLLQKRLKRYTISPISRD